MVLYLHKVARLLGLKPKELKHHIRLGNLHLNDAGYVDCDEIKILYPKEWERATKNKQIEYLEAVKDTCHNWKNGRKAKMAQNDKAKLVNTIRSLEAENYMLRQRIIELEEQIHSPCGMSRK